ncbi:TetR family transcriptional regulator [Deinococcus sp.]|uniref:TetR family transcriptional regulator n=1 Tax=Deinococcus sp. TaxID=47478 RepID=UPI0025DE9341|nr:TetR family transcriptional regulator [Deinococcus sp.]
MKRTQEDAALTREALLMAALSIFSRRGYAASTLAEIAQAAQVTRGALYHHFSGKSELYTTLIAQAAQQPGMIAAQAIAEGGDFLEIIRRVFVRQLELLSSDPTYRATAELVMFRLEYGPELDTAHTLLSAERAATLRLLTGAFEEARAQGAVRRDLAPEELSRSFMALQIGLFQLWSSGSHTFDLVASAHALADVLIAGLKPLP